MYAPQYGFGPGNPSPTVPFNPNGGPSQQPHPPHLQQQLPGQQPQHMMYNPQQFPGMAGAHQSPYAGPGAANAGAMGMMQNNGMAHMGAGGHAVPAYQTPYSSSPYGGSIPTSTAANLPPNFMPTSSNAPPMSMNTSMMNPQYQQAQRMQPPPPSSTPTQSVPRPSPFQGMPHNTPPNAGSAQSQFATPQNSNQPHNQQTPNNNQQQQASAIITPQTPNFPPGSQGGGILSTPLSPGSETRERERVSILLEINRELLRECLRLQTSQREEKKEEGAATPAAGSPDGSEREKAEKNKSEKEKPDKERSEKEKAERAREYVECMRRLQANLAYLAAIADRSHKKSSQIPPHPAIMSAPPLSPLKSQPNSSTTSPTAEPKKEESQGKGEEPADERIDTLKGFYKKLQDLFPGVDPKKEPPMPSNAARQQQAAAQMQAQKQMQQNQAQNQGQGQGPPTQVQIDAAAQQKMQNELLRQKMMQAQQQMQNAQQQQIAQAQAQNQGQGMNSQQQQPPQGMGAQQIQNR